MKISLLLLLGIILVGQKSFVDPAAIPNPLPHHSDQHHEEIDLVAHTTDKSKIENKDVEVRELEKLKENEDIEGKSVTYVESHSKLVSEVNGHKVEHEANKEYVSEDGKLVASLDKQVNKVAEPNSPPEISSKTELEIPSKGIHETIEHSGHQTSTEKHDDDEQKEMGKSFPGAARLMQSAPTQMQAPPGMTLALPPALAVARRATRQPFNADISRETENNMDHFNSYVGVQYSPLDMAEYIYWTGDEKGVTNAIEDFLQNGMMTKDEAILFLQEIKFNIDYLQAHYSSRISEASEEKLTRDRMKPTQFDDIGQIYNLKEINGLHNSRPLMTNPYENGNLEMMRTIANGNYERNNNIIPPLNFPITTFNSDGRPDGRFKRNMQDSMLQTNIISTSDYDRDGMSLDDDYEELMEKLRVADFLYTEYSMEEVIYQLAKTMFTQSLSRGSMEAQIALQRFTNFLEIEAETGRISRSLEKKILDVLIAALTDTLTDHPELVATAREGLGAPSAGLTGNRLLHQLLELGPPDHGVTKAGIMAAYRDEIAKIQNMHNQMNNHHTVWAKSHDTAINDDKPLGFGPFNPYLKRA